MGRTKFEGPKNLAKLVDNPRFVRVFLTKNNRRLPSSLLLSADSYDLLAAGFERRGFTVEKAQI